MDKFIVLPQQRAFAWKLLWVFLGGGSLGLALWFLAVQFGLIRLPGALAPLRKAELPFIYTTLGVYWLLRVAFVNLLNYVIGGVIFALSGAATLVVWGVRRWLRRR